MESWLNIVSRLSLRRLIVVVHLFYQISSGLLSILHGQVQRERYGAGQHVRPSDERVDTEGRRE